MRASTGLSHESKVRGAGDRRRRYVRGSGAIEPAMGGHRLSVHDTGADRYGDAQIDDYGDLPRRRFPWSPPLRLEARVRFSHPAGRVVGTAGFGFWNDPFVMTGGTLPALPRAIWFFYASPPSNMKLDLGTPGFGWKAATIDALRPIAGLLVPLTPAAIVLMNVVPIYRAVWPIIQRAIHVREAVIGVEMSEWHTYSLEWGTETSTFAVDGETILRDAPSPRGPLGFVMWLDNQYMVATPRGRFRWGLLDVRGHQWMQVADLTIERQ